MYDKTSAKNHRIYNITIPTSNGLVYDLLSAEDKADYDAITTNGMVVDGYIISTVTFGVSTFADNNSAVDGVWPDEKYYVPVIDWPKKTWVYADEEQIATIRIFIS